MSQMIQCPECGDEFETEFNEEEDICPNCGFDFSNCDHPQEYRDEEIVTDFEEGRVRKLVCTKCGELLH